MPSTYTSPVLDLSGLGDDYSRADIQFHGVDHSGPSFEARVFLDNPEADESTPLSAEARYAGSFYIFGHGGCFGDEGHCDVEPRRLYDPRPAHPLTPAEKVVIATETIRDTQSRDASVRVTVVPIITGTTPKCDNENFLSFESLEIVTYR